MRNHEVTEAEIENYLNQPIREMLACQSGGGMRKDLYAVIHLRTHAIHYTVSGTRYDTLQEAVRAYNAAQGIRE